MDRENSDPLVIAATIVDLAHSGLFDSAWCVANHKGIASDDGDPLVYFSNGGWRKGIKPNFYFDTDLYISRNADVRTAGINPLLHYYKYGEAENRPPSDYFDVAWYRKTCAIGPGVSCLADYLRRRHSEPVSPNGGFDAVWYAAQYGDVVAGGWDLFEHYISYGVKEGREPSLDVSTIRRSGLFDARYYLKTYPNVRKSAVEPLYHFCATGWRRGFKPNACFDTEWYLSTNPDVKRADINPLVHYIRSGEAENRRPCAAFDVSAYRDENHLDVEESCLAHYLRQEAGSDITDVDKPILAVPALAVPAIIEPNPSDAAPDTGAADIASDTIAEIELITASELLDVNYYLINYPDVRECDLSPAEHFCRYGWREGRRPNPYFDPAWYLKTYFLIPDDSVNPLVHYIKFGEAAGYKPIIYFDPEWYREKYRINTDGHLLAHFLKNRRRQKYSPISFFDVEWYLERHRAEIGANRDPFAHYLRVGISKDIDPGPDFDAKRYRLTAMGQTAPPPNPIAGAEIHEKLNREIFNPLVHYLLKKARAPLRDAQAPSIRNLLNKLLPSSLTR